MTEIRDENGRSYDEYVQWHNDEGFTEGLGAPMTQDQWAAANDSED